MEMPKFMKENEAFLEEKFIKEGTTNLGVYYTRFREEQLKKKQSQHALMIPPTQQMEPPKQVEVVPPYNQ